MGKGFTVPLILILLTALVILPPATVKAQSKTIVVPDDYPTIGTAIANSDEGDSLFVKSGTYKETTLIINKSISLIGENVANTTLILNPPFGQVQVFTLQAVVLKLSMAIMKG